MKVIISGGGTGGHIFPAISIANEIKRRSPETEILFVGANKRMEMEKVPAAGYEIIGLPVEGLTRKFSLRIFKFLYKLFISLRKSKSIIKKFNPDITVGVGGYASGPLLYAATNAKVKTLIQEQNSFPGITNKLLAKRVDVICTAYDNMDRFFPANKIVKTGNPIRNDIIQNKVSREKAVAHFGFNPLLKTILVLGGSLGARTVNKSVVRSLNTVTQQNIQLIWQTGKSFYHEAKEIASGYKNIRIFEFISEMDYAFSCADIILSRAGASTISELCVIGKPAILIPSPNVAEDHQTKNALALADKNAALYIPDVEAEDKLMDMAIELINNQEKKEMLSKNISDMAIRNSAELIVDEVLKLVGSK